MKERKCETTIRKSDEGKRRGDEKAEGERERGKNAGKEIRRK